MEVVASGTRLRVECGLIMGSRGLQPLELVALGEKLRVECGHWQDDTSGQRHAFLVRSVCGDGVACLRLVFPHPNDFRDSRRLRQLSHKRTMTGIGTSVARHTFGKSGEIVDTNATCASKIEDDASALCF